MYTYTATIERVIDGDTVRMTVDTGFHVTFKDNFRLADINAPELNTPEGQAARVALQAMLPVGSRFIVITTKADKYGRWLARIYDQMTGESINDRLLRMGHATLYGVKVT